MLTEARQCMDWGLISVVSSVGLWSLLFIMINSSDKQLNLL